MSTVYQEIVAGKSPGLNEVLARRQKQEKELVNIKESWDEWTRDPKTQVFVSKLAEIQKQKEEALDAKMLGGELSKDECMNFSMEIATIRNVIRLINTGTYISVGNILYK
jgi:hypothetical protein